MTGLDLGALRSALVDVAVPADAAPMTKYMKGQFDFMGVKSPARRSATKAIVAASKRVPVDETVTFARSCWSEPEREFQYVGCDVLAHNRERLAARHLDDLEAMIRARSWWDTVDVLASPTVGALVRSVPTLVETMDEWVARDDIWIARTAIIHQLRFGADTDADRLFAYCLHRSADTEFFIRKAIGWALRQYGRTDPDAVRAFVAEHSAQLFGLSKREALKHL